MDTTGTAVLDVRRAEVRAPRILVVDDEPALAELLSMAMRMEGWEVETATDGFSGVRMARASEPDVVLLDVMMPGMDGFEAMRRIRAHDPGVPVMFLTACDAVEDWVAGLAAGGDDYVTKPFSLVEVIARVRGLLRRSGASTVDTSLLTVGDLTLDESSRQVRRRGRDITLTATEFELLRYLMHNARRVVSKAQILDQVWQYDFGGQANVVEIYISYLRKKLDAGNPPMIHTLRGVGYVLKPAS